MNAHSQQQSEVGSGDRFEFGKNWANFLELLNEERLDIARRSLQSMLGVSTLAGKSFLDAGSGSGLFSLAARQLGATVHSFDYDPQSVQCTTELKRRYFPNDARWTIQQASVLDEDYMSSLGQYEVVYSWGVLHHTGNMYGAFRAIASNVAPGGQLFIAIYNDQGFISKYWTLVKRAYNHSRTGRVLVTMIHAPYLFGVRWLLRALTGRLHLERGMSMWHDMIDWLGGYPFEVATPEAVKAFFQPKGFVVEKMTTCGSRMGCNEFVMGRTQ